MRTWSHASRQYMEKALKEAKLHTSWINPHDAYDQAVKRFVREVLRPDPDNRFLGDFLTVQGRVAQAGMWTSLSQTLIKVTSPGVPDMYQGHELWDLSLVDPDNRQPVDFRKRVTLLEDLQRQESKGLASLLRELVARRTDGRLKLYITYKALNFRRNHRDLFEHGAYHPLASSGAQAHHVIAYARQLEDRWAVVVVPRFVSKLAPSTRPPMGKRLWKDTRLQLPEAAPSHWQNIFSGASLAASDHTIAEGGLFVHEVFQGLPVALLMGSSS